MEVTVASSAPAAPAVQTVALPAAPGPSTLARDSLRRRLLALADSAGLVAAFALMWTLVPAAGPLTDRAGLLALLPAWIVINKLLGLYDRDDTVIHPSSLDELPRILQSVLTGTMLAFLAAPVLLAAPLGRPQVVVFVTLAFLLTPALRTGARVVVRRRLAAERCLILGTCPAGRAVARKLTSHPEYGIELVGFLGDGFDGIPAPAPVLGDLRDLEPLCQALRIDRVVVAFADDDETLTDVVRRAKHARLKVTVVPRLHEVVGRGVLVDEVEGMTVHSLRPLGRSRSTLIVKRAIDVAGAGLGLLLLSPLLLAIALAIKLTSRGPVLYRSTRIGRNRQFEMLKFRTMVVGADAMKAELRALNEADGPMFKILEDPRITRCGRFLRRTSLDELPQLVNVLRGEMSLVGPRPLVPDEDDHVLGWHRDRLALTPGLTGPWQVAGRTAIPFQEMIRMDYLYVAEWSLWTDIRLLLRTLPVVFLRRGA